MKIFRYAPTNPNAGTTTDEINAEQLKEKISSESNPRIDVDLTVDKLSSRNSRAVINLSMEDLEVLHQNYTERLKTKGDNLEKKLKDAQIEIGELRATLSFISKVCSKAPYKGRYDENQFLSYLENTAEMGSPEDIEHYFSIEYDHEKEEEIEFDVDFIIEAKERFEETINKPHAGYIDFSSILDK